MNEYEILKSYYDGYSFDNIGKKYGYSKSSAARKFKNAIAAAENILLDLGFTVERLESEYHDNALILSCVVKGIRGRQVMTALENSDFSQNDDVSSARDNNLNSDASHSGDSEVSFERERLCVSAISLQSPSEYTSKQQL